MPNEEILARLEAIERNQHDILVGQRALYRQTEALFALYNQIDFRAPLIGMRGWAASPDLAIILYTQIMQQQPKVVVELGSGQTTLISAYALSQQKMGHVYALDHDQRFAQLTRDNIARHHLRDHATILDAPLQTHSINDQNWQWYDDTALPRGIAIDILVVDGPPQHAIQDDLIRYPALPRLFHHLAPHATIIVDDADREAETAVVDRWLQEFPLSLIRHYEQHYGDSDGGIKILRRTDASSD